ncbi:condensin complex protein MksE [Thiomicrospira microaerophila]|uniref:condensin complex protein MksE n=1 Tax=Thiomicrospira microaerophila TaxID=406020 RepID=UPI0005CB3C81|nr:hypothetical protein [Thiomicrospira microaerophila]
MEIAHIARTLLSGNTVCDQAYHDWYATLEQSERIRSDVNDILVSLGFKLYRSPAGEFYKAMFDVYSDTDEQKKIRQHLQEAVDLMMPLLGFLDLIGKADGRYQYLDIGDRVELTQIDSVIQLNSVLKAELIQLSQTKFFKSSRKADTSWEQLKAVFEKLSEKGLLTSKKDKNGTYFFTGHFGYLKELYLHIQQELVGEVLDDDMEQASLI